MDKTFFLDIFNKLLKYGEKEIKRLSRNPISYKITKEQKEKFYFSFS